VFITSHSFVYLTDKIDVKEDEKLAEPVYENTPKSSAIKPSKLPSSAVKKSSDPLFYVNRTSNRQPNSLQINDGPLRFTNGFCTCFTSDNVYSLSNKNNSKHKTTTASDKPNVNGFHVYFKKGGNNLGTNGNNQESGCKWEQQQIAVYIGEILLKKIALMHYY
jgi:hypothetical protein